MKRQLDISYEEALEKVPEALKTEGFGVLTEIDIKATLKAKLDADFRPYKILGACNPPLAHAALQADLEVGLMLPCNVVVYAGDDGKAVVQAIDPTQTLAAKNPKLVDVAGNVRDKLAAALARI
ncbi:MAG: DUF302 domain-containing protein [Myxococcales bacterium]|nr:DUF302 domain-containing protein [Myxococcales bacterium]MCB9606771.1 DUF302 domain-containing protein [Polyangiaceae bacterium]